MLTEPWTVWLVPHFHYDPVWWNTQAAYTQTWDDPRATDGGAARFAWPGHSAFNLIKAHLAKACQDPDYRFVLAQVDYLKPYWDTYPEDRTHPATAHRRPPGTGRRHIQRTQHQPHLCRDDDPQRRARHRVPTAHDLLDRPAGELPHDGRRAHLDVRGYKITSLALRPARAEPGTATLVPDAERIQPVFTRYWLHNSGPAPMGNLPVTITLRPDDAPTGNRRRLQAQVVSNLVSTWLAATTHSPLAPGFYLLAAAAAAP